MGLAEARVIAVDQQLIKRFAMAIGGEQVAEPVKGEPEWVHLAMRVMLNARAIEPDAVGIAGIKIHLVPVLPLHVGIVVITVRGVKPAIEPAAEAGLVAMRVARVVEGPI